MISDVALDGWRAEHRCAGIRAIVRRGSLALDVTAVGGQRVVVGALCHYTMRLADPSHADRGTRRDSRSCYFCAYSFCAFSGSGDRAGAASSVVVTIEAPRVRRCRPVARRADLRLLARRRWHLRRTSDTGFDNDRLRRLRR